MINIFSHDWDWAFTIWTSSCYWICLEHEIWTFSGKVGSWLPLEWSSCWGRISTLRISTGTSHPNPCSLEIHVEYNVPTAYTFASRVFRWNFLRPTLASPWRSILILIFPPFSAESDQESSPSWRDVRDYCGYRTSWNPSPTRRWCNPRTKRRRIDPNLGQKHLRKNISDGKIFRIPSSMTTSGAL